MEEWAGLGYYARARNLHACARAVAAAGGAFPSSVAGLRALPGVGAYTAAAVGAIAFGLPVVPLDGNVERLMARWHGVRAPLPGAKPRLDALAQGLMAAPAARAAPGAVAQALFDLGATVCTARRPACALCPWRPGCAGAASGDPAALPIKPAKRERPLRHGCHFLLRDAAGLALVRRRPPEGLLGGMLELPGTPWRDVPWAEAEALPHAPLPGLGWRRAPGLAEHGFTHFRLALTLLVAEVPALAPPDGMELRPLAGLAAALPTAFRRVLALA
jgi:A/G-specific adenine glycosylase